MTAPGQCTACDAPNASQPSFMVAGALLCEDVEACLDRALGDRRKIMRRRRRAEAVAS